MMSYYSEEDKIKFGGARYKIYITGDVCDADEVMTLTEVNPEDFELETKWALAFILQEILGVEWAPVLEKYDVYSLEDVLVVSEREEKGAMLCDFIDIPSDTSYNEDCHTITDVSVEYWVNDDGHLMDLTEFRSLDWKEHIRFHTDETRD